MTSWYNLGGDWDNDDMERLEALASYKPALSFEEAFSRLENGTDRAVAEAAWTSFLAYHQPSGSAPAS